MEKFLNMVKLSLILSMINFLNLHAQWENISTNTTNDNLYAVIFINESTGIAVGWSPSSTIIKTTDGGKNWANLNTPAS